MAIDETELLKIRVDYAWKYFDSAARHRMLFFNYFLLAVGILASAYGFAIKEALHFLALFVCLFGAVASASFVVFDIRMLSFVNRALHVLETLERESLFPDGYMLQRPGNPTGVQLGLARIEPDARLSNKHNCWTSFPKVKWWIRSVEAVAFGGFLVGVIYAGRLTLAPTVGANHESHQSNCQTTRPAAATQPAAASQLGKQEDPRCLPRQ